MKIDFYFKAVFTIIAVCLIKIAFFAPPDYSYAQFPFLSSSGQPVDVNIKSIDGNELIFSRNGDLWIGKKEGPKIIEEGAWVVKLKKD